MRFINQVLNFIDTLEKDKHLVLFYEETEYAQIIKFRFIKNGLLRGEHCIYTTHDDSGNNSIDAIEREMIDHGIDVEYFKRKNLLHICKIIDPRHDPAGLKQGVDNLRNILIFNLSPPVRLVSRFIRKVDTEDEKQANMFVERTIHSAFEKYRGSFLCYYPVKSIAAAIENEWMKNHLRNHHAVIYVTKSGTTIALHLPGQFKNQ